MSARLASVLSSLEKSARQRRLLSDAAAASAGLARRRLLDRRLGAGHKAAESNRRASFACAVLDCYYRLSEVQIRTLDARAAEARRALEAASAEEQHWARLRRGIERRLGRPNVSWR